MTKFLEFLALVMVKIHLGYQQQEVKTNSACQYKVIPPTTSLACILQDFSCSYNLAEFSDLLSN